jgi:hypothetical protein
MITLEAFGGSVIIGNEMQNEFRVLITDINAEKIDAAEECDATGAS